METNGQATSRSDDTNARVDDQLPVLQLTEPRWPVVASAYLAGLARTLDLVPAEALAAAIQMLLDARAAGRRVYVMGNGGSAATASHLACDLLKTAHVDDHAPLRVFSLTDNTPLLTAVANDVGYEHGFAEQIVALVEPGDVVIAISASGNSRNIVAGLTAASRVGARTIGLLGFDGGTARDLVDIAIHIPRNDYGLVEDTHSAVGHAMTAAIHAALLAHRGPSVTRSDSVAAHAWPLS